MTDLCVETSPADVDVDDDETHVYCCRNKDTGICGTSLTDGEVVDADEETTCVVCHDLEGSGRCPLDGRRCPTIIARRTP